MLSFGFLQREAIASPLGEAPGSSIVPVTSEAASEAAVDADSAVEADALDAVKWDSLLSLSASSQRADPYRRVHCFTFW